MVPRNVWKIQKNRKVRKLYFRVIFREWECAHSIRSQILRRPICSKNFPTFHKDIFSVDPKMGTWFFRQNLKSQGISLRFPLCNNMLLHNQWNSTGLTPPYAPIWLLSRGESNLWCVIILSITSKSVLWLTFSNKNGSYHVTVNLGFLRAAEIEPLSRGGSNLLGGVKPVEFHWWKP